LKILKMKYHRKTVGKHTSKHTRKNSGAKFGMRKTMKGGGMFDNLFTPSEWSIFKSTPQPATQAISITPTPTGPTFWESIFGKKKEVPPTSFTMNPMKDNEKAVVENAVVEKPVGVETPETGTGAASGPSGPPGLSGLTGKPNTGGWMWGGRKRRAKKNKTAKKSGLKKGGGKK
jgi:hypothetical protein